ncbi:MAG: hypothetical protein ACRD8O_09290 [Bryobacteraceae bacterium]
MATRYNWMADTQPKPFEVWVELQRRMTPGEKLAQVFEMAAMMIRAYEDRVRKQHPHANPREIFLRAAALRLGSDTVKRVYGWDPENGNQA